jgi:hypothetical protein
MCARKKKKAGDKIGRISAYVLGDLLVMPAF